MTIVSEAKVGFLVILAVIIFGWLSLQSGVVGSSSGSLGKGSRTLNTEFASVEGIGIGSKVKFVGVQVGEVNKIYINERGLASVIVVIDKTVKLPANIQAKIASSGLIGEKFVSLSTEFTPQGVLSAETKSIPGIEGGGLDDIATSFAKISKDLEQVTGALRVSVGGDENAKKLSRIVDNIDTITENFAGITENLASGEGFLGKLLTEDSTALDDFSTAMADIQEVAAKINKGEGTIGRLINDPATSEKIDNALDSFAELSGRLESFRTEVDFDGYMLPAEGVSKGHFTITFRPRPNRYYVIGATSDGFSSEADDIDSDASFKGEEFGDNLKITMQFGHVFDGAFFNKDLGFRVGVKDSSFGVGADMAFYGNFIKISADLYDFGGENTGSSKDTAHLDITARVNIVDNTLYGMIGYDNILNDKYGSPFIGLGIKFQDDDLKYLIGQAL